MKWSLLIFVGLLACAPQPAHLIITNAKIWTVDEQNPVAEAAAVRGNRILAVGSADQVQKLSGKATHIIDAGGRLVLPGFNDAHLHFLSGGESLMEVNLNDSRTPGEIQRRIREKAAQVPKGTWITGRGWDHTLFNDGRWPDKKLLDEAAPDHPVWVRRVDGHVGWANSKALEIAGVNEATASPAGGEIVRDQTGEPTGILKESAMGLVGRVVPEISTQQKRLAAEKAVQLAASLGITSVQDNSGIESVEIYRQLLDEDKLTVRITEWMDFDALRNPEKMLSDRERFGRFTKTNRIEIGLLKGFVDGTLGSRTAWFFQPYADDPTITGLPQYDEEELTDMICIADSLGLQVGLHCIGAKANWAALQGFAEAQMRYGKRDSRHRLEHAQVLRLEDIPELDKLGVIASMQPTHCTSDMRWAEERIGHERSKGAYAWKRILESGGKIAFGTDWPVEPLDPMRGLYSAVTRQSIGTGEPEGGWFPDQRLSLAEAIRLYTLDAAYGEFKENEKGSITPGKLADMIILSDDLFSIPPEQILSTRVEVTVFDGRIVYERGN